MKRIIALTYLLSFFYVANFAQEGRKLNESEKAIFEQRMVEESKKINTLQCAFLQEKTSSLVYEKAVAKGVLLYQSPNMLRWEYTTPTPSVLILNGSNAALLDKNGKKISGGQTVKPLGNIIISMINGNGITNNKLFSTEISEGGNHFLIVLTPTQKRLKEFYKTIELKIDTGTFLASEIIMNEKSGDKMHIYLNDKKLNNKIDVENFGIR